MSNAEEAGKYRVENTHLVQGQVIGDHTKVYNTYQPPTPPQIDPDRERMLRRLGRSYKELLDQSLHGIAWVELGLSARSDMVSNITNLLFQLPHGGERLLAPGTRVLSAYDEAEGELLILGAPGAGKSTLLLDLAQQLVNRALADPGHPLPVILRLSSWAAGRPSLDDWMVEHLSHTYDVPRRLSERWVKQERLLPLLDGLDEMEETARPACIAAINSYHSTHLVPLVVCSRQTEYEAAATKQRLVLQSAVIVQLLSEAQVEGALRAAGPSFAGVQTAFEQEQALRELATTPLMLSVLLLTYQGTPAQRLLHQGTDLEREVWTDYVARQVAEKGWNTRYPLERTRAWLSWLAGQMRTHQRTIFSAEYLQDDWLGLDQQRTVTWLATRLPAIVLGGCVGVLVSLLVGGDSSLVSLLQFGLMGGFVGSRLSLQVAAEPMSVRKKGFAGTQAHVRNALLLGLLVAASQDLSFYQADPNYWLHDGRVLGLGSLLSGWAFQVLLDRTSKQWLPVLHTHRGLRGRLATWMNTIGPPHIWQAALVFGGGIGLSVGLSYGLSGGLMSVGLSDGLRDWLSVGLILLFPGIVVMWSLSGGLTVLRHYLIRWLLTRHHTFPWRAQAFLDDATTRILLRRVGGGYSFIHRRLQDYFADAAVPPC